jgi:hypothetical protein
MKNLSTDATTNPARRFLGDRPSTQQLQGTAALEKIARVTGPHAIRAAYAEAIATANKQRWADSLGLVESRLDPCPEKLTGRCGPTGCCGTPSWGDHPSLWALPGDPRPVLYVGQPYGLSREDVAELNQYCHDRGLEAEIDTELSWHYPSRTLLVQLATPEGWKRIAAARARR